VAPRQRSRRRAHARDVLTEYRERIAAALADGWRFAGLHASSGGTVVRALLARPDGSTRLETAAVDEGRVESIVDLAPAAGWDEREAHDLHGVGFVGHEPLRPLVDHDLRLDRWTVPVRGHDPYQIAVGPIHAGVIESGHFRFHVVGDRILHLDARLFYKHRGLERAAEGATLDEGIAFAARACAACAVTNGVAYAHACEDALGLVPTAELARARTILLELERMWSHLNDIATVCAGVGLAVGNNRFAAFTERARRLNATLTGHRFLFGSVRVGGSDLRLDGDQVGTARAEVDALRTESSGSWRELLFNASFQDRLPDVGIVTAAEAARLGAVGPAARASGIGEDVRASSPRLAYGAFAPAVPRRAAGDVRARLEQRALELLQTFALLERLLDRPVAPARAERGASERPIGVGRVESARGATSCVVERVHDRVERLRLRTGSYANWPVVAHAAADNLLPDFPLINKSFELCYACADR
jgi:Ni,Fe-hydrogenase III large subunit